MMNQKEIKKFIHAFTHLNVNRAGGRPSPHKPVMLLAVLELAEAGLLTENRIYYTPQLLEPFRSFFQVVKQAGDASHPYFPFFHLHGDKFWHLEPLPGRGEVLTSMKTVRGPSDITETIAYAYLDDELFSLMQCAEKRAMLRKALIDEWFQRDGQVLRTVAVEEKETMLYAKVLKDTIGSKAAENSGEGYSTNARSAGFSRVVREVYDYRCAASGWRVILPDGSVMVEAAHLIPFAASHDDDPKNGIALAPTFHWVLDSHILAPGPDLKWHVSPLLDKRNRDLKDLLELENKHLLLPTDKKYYPRMDALEWRMDHLIGR